MKYFLIMNPGSRSGKSKKLFRKIFNYLDEFDINYEYKITINLDSAYNLSLKANRKKYNVIVAIGGDGTINKVINGFFDDEGNRISESKFGVIYTGTSPDFCKSYNIPWGNYKDALQILLKGKTQKIKLGKIKLVEELESQEFTTKYFACCANIGLGATLARNANSGIRKYFGDNIGTFISLIKTLKNYNANNFEVKINDKIKTIENMHSLSIGLTKYIASGIQVKHDLQENNFYSLIVKNMMLSNLPDVLKKIYSGKKIINNDVVTLDYLNEIEIMENSQNPEVEFDGDPQGFLPCKIEIAEDELELLIS